MARVSQKLNSALEGALAGGGDPATSPLYVFGPFLKLIVIAGVAQITFGVSIWMVVLTIIVVSAMYRLVMKWVTDGSGGSGLSEEEFGGWAVKTNAAITFIEYTLTFLVSMAAMVTFIADRFPILNGTFLWFQYRAILAIGLSILTGWLVNRGPKVAARAFGPATGGVLVLLWIMIATSIFEFGFKLPDFNLEAFSPAYLGFTFNGYARILAVMTGIEVFANLVAAYGGTPAQKSKKAFNSLLIIMGTTAATMLIVGPAILLTANPSNPEVSVFTQTMDRLLPDPLPYLGTLVGIAVLMSASAASAQGLQNLALGLNERNYIPHSIGQRNKYEVAEKPVWIEVAIVVVCFLVFGTHEETYLAIYAAGVFILLSMTGWAVSKRLLREIRVAPELRNTLMLVGTSIAAILTTFATVIIFIERFFEGAWTYFIFVPVLYMVFSYFRRRLGDPSPEMEYLGLLDASQLAGFGFGQYESPVLAGNGIPGRNGEISWQPVNAEGSSWKSRKLTIDKVLVLLDGSISSEVALPFAKTLCEATQAELHLLSSIKHNSQDELVVLETLQDRAEYLDDHVQKLKRENITAFYHLEQGFVTEATLKTIRENDIDLVVTSTTGHSGANHWTSGGVSRKLIQRGPVPVLLVQELKDLNEQNDHLPLYRFKRILVALDGSIASERTLPYAFALSKAFKSEVIFLSVPAVPETDNYRAPAEFIETLRTSAIKNMRIFLDSVSQPFKAEGLSVKTMVTGSLPARTIVNVCQQKRVDLIILASQGRGGYDAILLGSVADRVVQQTTRPVFMVPSSYALQEEDQSVETTRTSS